RLDGLSGNITVTAEGLPEGVSCAPVTIGPGLDATPLVLVAAETAPAFAGPIQIVGRAKIGDAEVAHAARAGTVLFAGQPSRPAPARMARSPMLAVSAAEPAPFLVEFGEN